MPSIGSASRYAFVLLAALATSGSCRTAQEHDGATTFRTSSFLLGIPSNAVVRPTRATDSGLVAGYSISGPGSSFTLFAYEYRLVPAITSRQAARLAHHSDSIQSAANDWGVPGPVKEDTIAGNEAWGFEPTCGDCTMYRVYLSRGETLVAFEYVFAEDQQVVPRQRTLYRRILSSFHWRGA